MNEFYTPVQVAEMQVALVDATRRPLQAQLNVERDTNTRLQRDLQKAGDDLRAWAAAWPKGHERPPKTCPLWVPDA